VSGYDALHLTRLIVSLHQITDINNGTSTRVQTALSKLPQDDASAGVTVQKNPPRSSS